MSGRRNLIIIEELPNTSSSAGIVNKYLSDIIASNFGQTDLLTLDNIDADIQSNWYSGEIYTHPKNNLGSFEKKLKRHSKIYAVVKILYGNDFEHFHRVQNIIAFLKQHKDNYKNILLLSGGAGFSPHFAISKINFTNQTKLVGVFHDPYPASSFPLPYSEGSNWYFDYFKRRNMKRCLSKIDKVIFPSKRLYEWYLRDYSIDNNKVNVIPHAVNFTEVKSENMESTRIVITHTGTLLQPRNPKSFLEVVNRLALSNLFIQFYGSIHKNVYADIQSFDKSKNICIMNNRIPYESALKELRDSDFLLLIESDALDSPFLPTKFVDYINIGVPILVLSPPNSEVSRLLGLDYPYLSELNDKEKILDILQNKINNQLYKNVALSKIETLKSYFSEKNIVKAYDKIYQ